MLSFYLRGPVRLDDESYSLPNARKNPEYHLESRSIADIIHVSLFLAERGIELRTFHSCSSPSHLTTYYCARKTHSPEPGHRESRLGVPVSAEHTVVLGNARGASGSPVPESCFL